MNVLVIDVGTSSMRGILFDQRGGELIRRQVKYHPDYRSAVWIEQSATDFYDSLLRVTQGVSDEARGKELAIDLVVITAQRSAVIPLDCEGDPLMPAVMWQDTRNATVCKQLEEENDLIFALSGAKVNTVFSGGKMAWIKRECSEISGKVRRFVNIAEYLIYRMTGQFVTDHTYGSRSNLMNLQERKWDARLLKIFGIEEDELSSLQEPGSVVGYLTKDFAEISGLCEGLPLISAGGDQQCASVGLGAVAEGKMSLVVGTGAYLVVSCDCLPTQLPQELICNCSAISKKYILEANLLTCSSAFDWYLRNFCEDGEDKYEKVNRELEKMYAQVGDELVLPYFQGKSGKNWNPEAKAFFANITLATTRESLLKALVEGVFLEIDNCIKTFREYINLSQIYISGGMTNSQIMNQMQTDIYGIPLRKIDSPEATANGALMIALTKQGIYKTVDEAFRTIYEGRDTQIYWPKPEKTIMYEEKRNEINRLYNAIYL